VRVSGSRADPWIERRLKLKRWRGAGVVEFKLKRVNQLLHLVGDNLVGAIQLDRRRRGAGALQTRVIVGWQLRALVIGR
jgi:hypothetical protein